MGGEEQKRAHVENVQQHPAQKRETGGLETRGETREGGRTEESL